MRPHHLVPHRGSRLSAAAVPAGGGVAAPGGAGVKHRMKEQEEYIRDWTAHSEEIARYWSFFFALADSLKPAERWPAGGGGCTCMWRVFLS